MKALTSANETAPLRDSRFDWPQRPGGNQRSREHHAWGDGLIDHENGTDSEDQRLQNEAKGLGQRAERGCGLADLAIELRVALIGILITPKKILAHAKRSQHLGIAAARFQAGLAHKSLSRER